MSLEIDFETASDVDIRTHGVYRYMMHSSTRPLFCWYSIDGGPLQYWEPPAPCPADLGEHVRQGRTIKAHNAGFERLLMTLVLTRPEYGWPRPSLTQFVCTAATAAAMSLPRSLGDLGAALNLNVQKNKDGMRLIRKFSIQQHRPEDHPADWQKFKDYGRDDVATEVEADRKMFPLSQADMDRYHRSERINDRGIRIDVESAVAAIKLAETAKAQLDRDMTIATGGYVTACSQVAALTAWIENQGVPLDSLGKAELEELLEAEDLPANVRRALELRQEAAKTSVAKLSSFLDRVSDDGRIRGAFLFRAAGTGRYSSVGAQLHNLPRPRKEFGDAHIDTRLLFQNIRAGDPQRLKLMYGDTLGRPLHLLSDAIRGFIWAAPNHDLLVADYSGIEGAVAAWVAGEDWKLAAMHELIRNPDEPDLYRRAAAKIYNVAVQDIPKKDGRRQVGKVAELSCFGPDTYVLTSNGPKRIVEVLNTDLLWDGVEWIAHQGVVQNGVKPVVNVDGIELTADHLILVGQTWRPARQLVSSARYLYQALATGSENLPLSVLTTVPPTVLAGLSSRAPAGLRPIKFTSQTYGAALRSGVLSALRRRVAPRERTTGATLKSFRTTATGVDYLGVSRRVSTGVITQTTPPSSTMVGVVSRYIGVGTEELFWNTSLRYRGGMTPRLNSTELTSIKATSQGTCALLQNKKTTGTAAACASSKPGLQSLRPFYDIMNAGPRNRFTVLTDSGALVVHNCQYQGGVSAFRAMARGYGLKLDSVYPSVWAAADGERRERAAERYEECLARKEPVTQQLSREGWLAAELVKVGWRAAHPAICNAWKMLEEAMFEAVQSPGTVCSVLKVSYLVRGGFLICKLPSDRCLFYGNPRISEVEVPWADKEQPPEKREKRSAVTALGVNSVTKKWERFALYGGLAFENVVQAIALDLLENGIEKAEAANYPVIGHVHDEIITEIPRNFGDVAEFEKLICELPEWAEGLPLTASGWRGKRYRKD